MNRLTHKDIAIQLNKDIESTITISENVSRDIYLKCSYFEDFLEEHDCETLSDYTKQVRKEVCENIKQKIEKRNNGTRNANYSVEYKDGYSGCCCDLEDILDQIQDNI